MTVLVPYDGSLPAQKALEHAVTEHSDRTIVLLRVIEAAGGTTTAGIVLAQEALRERQEKVEKDTTEEVGDLVNLDGIDLEMETAIGQPAREIVKYAEDNDIEHIIVGNHGREGVSRILLGSVAEKVVRRAPCLVTVVR